MKMYVFPGVLGGPSRGHPFKNTIFFLFLRLNFFFSINLNFFIDTKINFFKLDKKEILAQKFHKELKNSEKLNFSEFY
jgi:hypothetical protein